MKLLLLLVSSIWMWLGANHVFAQSTSRAANVLASNWPKQAVEVPRLPLQFENMTVNDGLSEGSIQVILQDYQGYIWFGTGGGMDRYDGYEIVNYKPIPFDSTSISEGAINGLYEDPEGRLWITTSRGGLDLLDARRERFKHYYFFDENDPKSVGHDVLCKVHPSSSNALWICTLGGGLDRFDPDSETFEHFRNIPGDTTSISNNYVFDAYEDPSGYTWVATSNGLNRLNPQRTVFRHYFHTPGFAQSPSPDLGQWFRYIHPDPKDPYLLWLGSGDGLILFDTRTGTNRKYLSTFIYAIVNDPNEPDVLWLATSGEQGGLYRFNTATGHYSHYRHNPDDPKSLVSNRLFSVYADRSGIMWAGSANGRGVSRFDPKGTSFQHFRPSTTKSTSVWGIQEDLDGNIWLTIRDAAGQGELIRWNRKNGDVKNYAHDPGNPAGFGTGSLHPLHIDRNGYIWVGTDEGIEKLNPATSKITRYEPIPKDSNSRVILWQTISWNNNSTIYEDHNGNLWIGTNRGIMKFDPVSEEFTTHMQEEKTDRYLQKQDITAIIEDHSGYMWLGTMDGLYKLDPKTDKYKHFRHDPNDDSSLSDNLITALYERSREPGIIWVGTRGGGINRFDTRAEKSTYYTSKDGMPDNKIYAILEDNDGQLWLSTNRGITRFNPGTEDFKNFHVRHGLQSMEFNQGAAYRSSNGEMFFGGPNGLNVFLPDKMKTSTIPPEIQITEFKVFNKTVDYGEGKPITNPIWESKYILLPYDKNSVSFWFTAFHFKDPDHNQYAYRLDPIDPDWIIPDKQRMVTYSALKPGTYTFQVKAANSDGIWDEVGKSVVLTINPPWWQTGWAYGIYVLLLVGGFLLVDRLQRRRLLAKEREQAQIREAQLRAEAAKKQAETLKQLDEMKSQFFANISHEFRTPLTLILDPLDQLISKTKNRFTRRQLFMMRHQVNRLLSLIGQLLDLSLIDAGNMKLKAQKVNLVPFLKNIVFAFSSRAERENISLRFSTKENEVILYAEPDKLEKIFTNLLSNAFKFTPSHGKVHVSVCPYSEDPNRFVIITVKDTGQGISAEEQAHIFDRFYQVDASLVRKHEGSGIGLSLTKELIELHGGKIFLNSEPGFGSEFTVRLRLGRDHLKDDEIVHKGSQAHLQTTAGSIRLDEEEPWLYEFDSGEIATEDAPTILLVEDNEDVRIYLRQHLSQYYQVVEAVGGIQGLTKARSANPDLIIADVMMPEMDGITFCKTIKKDKNMKHIPVILLTAKASEESKVEGLEIGADDYIFKPFRLQELLPRVENLIEIRKVLREKYSEEMVLRPSNISLTTNEAEFIERVREIIEEEIGNSHFTVDMLSNLLNVSKRQLYRKLKKQTGLSPGGLIRMMRMKRAAQLLEQNSGNISEVAYAVGYNDPDYFSRLFRQTFGMPPSAYVENMP